MNSNCACGKQRDKLNSTNWKRHVDACKKRKTYGQNSISKFFKTTTGK